MWRILTVQFRDNQGAEDLYWCPETKKMYIRQPANVDSIVFWLTSQKWTGGYEADCPIKEGITMRVVDRSGTVLFEETLVKDEWNGGTSAKKVGDFAYEAINKIAEKMSEGLSTYDEWKDLLKKEKEKSGDTDYLDNWMYCYCNLIKETALGSDHYLGKKVYLVKRKYEHTKCDAKWTEFAVLTDDKLDYLAIAGYLLK